MFTRKYLLQLSPKCSLIMTGISAFRAGCQGPLLGGSHSRGPGCVREPGHRGGGEAHEGLCGLRSHPMLRGPWTKTHSLSPRTGKPQVSREASRGLEPGAWSSVPRVPGGVQVSGHLPQEVFLSTACTLAPPSRDHSEARRGLVSACHISGDTAALSGREPETPNVLQCTHITTTMLAVPCPRGGARVPGCLLRHRARCRC